MTAVAAPLNRSLPRGFLQSNCLSHNASLNRWPLKSQVIQNDVVGGGASNAPVAKNVPTCPRCPFRWITLRKHSTRACWQNIIALTEQNASATHQGLNICLCTQENHRTQEIKQSKLQKLIWFVIFSWRSIPKKSKHPGAPYTWPPACSRISSARSERPGDETFLLSGGGAVDVFCKCIFNTISVWVGTMYV